MVENQVTFKTYNLSGILLYESAFQNILALVTSRNNTAPLTKRIPGVRGKLRP
jgi:hypothetical protein